jgi:hypothetical protein
MGGKTESCPVVKIKEEKRYNHPPQTQVRSKAPPQPPLGKLPSDGLCSARGRRTPLFLARIFSLVYFDLQTPPRADPGTLTGWRLLVVYGGSSMLRSRLAPSSPPHPAGTGSSEDHSWPCTRGKPAPGKQPATSTTRSPGQLAQSRHPGQAPGPMPLPRRE